MLINNAGLVQEDNLAPIWDISDRDWQLALDVNLTGAFYCARAVARLMADQRRGKIINVASGFGLRGGRDLYTYCCSKGGLIQLTRVLAISHCISWRHKGLTFPFHCPLCWSIC